MKKALTFTLSIVLSVVFSAHAQLVTSGGVRILPAKPDASEPASRPVFSGHIPPQNSLVECLNSSTTDIRVRVVCAQQIQQIPVAEREPALSAAVLSEAARLGQELKMGRIEVQDPEKRAQHEQATRGNDGGDHSDYRWGIAVLLTESRDPRVIPHLLALNSGLRTMEALADFGEDAFPAVVAEVESGDMPSAAMNVLERMLERKTRKPLNASSRARILRLALERLTKGPREVHIVMAAITLASKTRDSEALGLVKRFATDRRAAEELGVSDPNDIDLLQHTAAEKLAEQSK